LSDEKGYIQFVCDWQPAKGVTYQNLPALIRWRKVLHEAHLVGVDVNGVGFGNMSERIPGSREFVITATQTGHIADLDASHFAHVKDHDVEGNRLSCVGAIRASSESLSHAILYDADPSIGAVVHSHDAESWGRLRGVVPTTDAGAEAGTVAMAREIGRIVRSQPTSGQGIIVMGGHKDGLLSFGRNITEASINMLRACDRDVPVIAAD